MAFVAAGLGLAFVVGRDGTPGWQVGRVVVVGLVVVAAWYAISRRGGARVAAQLAVGLVAVPVGVGFGGPHLAKTGTTAASAAGLAVLLGGLLLVGAGVAGLLRAVRRRFSVPSAIGVVLVQLALLWTLGQAVAATNVSPVDVGARTPGDVGLAYEDVTFPAGDGVALSGWYVPSRNGAAAVLLHGAGSTRSNVLDHAAVLARHGYGVLLYDARGHGRSEGRAMDFGWYGDLDLAGAVAFLEGEAGIAAGRIAAVGMSMGGEQAVGAAAAVDGIAAVVAEGATNRVAGDKDWLSDEYGLRGAVSESLAWLTYAFTDLLTAARPPAPMHEAVRAAPTPVLLIAAGDVADEALAGRYIRSASPGTVTLWAVPGTGHTAALRTHPGAWEERVTSFLDGSLGLAAAG
ncbi:MAG TPA: alpha/beta fold hydrolase [Acidimicrobiales bacterium]|nr:alpha/beta fold hydrolase [Acidimicrobiales bacterium]